jgi:LDH2 family malate/lactate/ureidoglycolate dehydrogenase
MKIKVSELNDLMVAVLSSKYYSKEEAQKIVEVFMYAELTGKNTQGVLKLLGTEPAQNIKPEYKAKIFKQTKVSALIDGGRSAGPLSAQFATDTAVSIAKENGFAVVSMNNTVTSIGAIGYYARKMAENNLIGIIMANCPRSVAPMNGLELVYGTNPIAFGFPTNEYPIVFDMATSAITWYGLVRAKALGQKIPDNVAIDKEGNITTDPGEAMGGAILPFDRSYKGFNLGMVVELFAGALSGASFVFDKGDETDDWGTTIIAFSPDLLIGTEQFKKNSSLLVKKVKSKKTKNGEIIHIPGYDTEMKMKEILKEGEIEVDDTILNQLKNI